MHVTQEPTTAYERILRKQKIRYLDLSRYSDLLDVGCGSGDVWIGVDRGPCELYGVEPDPVLREKARDTGLYSGVVREISRGLVGTFGCVAMLGVLEHIEDEEAFLDHYGMARELYVTVPNAASFHRYVGRELGIIEALDELGPQDQAIGHRRYYDVTALQKVLDAFGKRHGLKVQEMGTVGFKFTTNEGMKPFMGRHEALERAASRLGITGRYCLHGAEIFAWMVRR